MTLLICWVAAPMLLLLLATGCGLLADHMCGSALDTALIPVLGLAAMIVVCVLVTLVDPLAPLAAPAVVTLSICGYALTYPWHDRSIDRWALVGAAAAFAAFAAPIVLSGGVTFAGFITLDDSATWFALASHMVQHGSSLGGLAPSTYEQVLHDNLSTGYPLGAFALLGMGGTLISQPLTWLLQPLIATLGAALALAIYSAVGSLVSSRPLRAVVALIGAQPALLFSYAFWTGIKEMTVAVLIVLVCALTAATLDRWKTVRGALPAAIAMAAVLGVLGLPGGIWLVGPGAYAAVVLIRRGGREVLRGAICIVPLVAVLSLPAVIDARAFLARATGTDLTGASTVANLGHPLNVLQVLGIWPALDFRVDPHNMPLTYILLAVLTAAMVIGTVAAVSRSLWGLPLLLGTATIGVAFSFGLDRVGLSSPWLEAKAMAEASPAFVTLAMVGIATVLESGRRTEGVLAGVAVAAGVLWSNGLAYANVWLAPAAQLSELQTIDSRFAGGGPTLMTEYLPVAERYILRDMAAEGASERRFRPDLLRNGQELAKSTYADLDAFQLGTVLTYRTLVLRRSPVESRPPSIYTLVWKGRFYEVWQRPNDPPRILAHLPLGNVLDPAAVPSCRQVVALGRLAARAGGEVATVVRPQPPIVIDLAYARLPTGWRRATGEPGAVVADGPGSIRLAARVPATGRYTLWLGGSFRRTLSVAIDGREIGSASDQLNNTSMWTPLGAVRMAAGSHTIELSYGGSLLLPGSGGFAFAMGPFALGTTTANLPVTYVQPVDAHMLCGKRLDWVEAIG